MPRKPTTKSKAKKPATIHNKLTGPQRVFIREYVQHMDGKRAAIAAGVKPSTAEIRAAIWLNEKKYPHVVHAVRAELQEIRSANQATAQRVIEELARIAFLNPKDLFNEDGTQKQVHELDDDTARALQSIKCRIVKQQAEDGSGETQVTQLEIRLWSKPEAMQLLARHFGILDPAEGKSGQAPVNVIINCSSREEDRPRRIDVVEQAIAQAQGQGAS